MQDNRSAAEVAYDRAMVDIRKQLTVAQGGTAAEARAQAAYKVMVREGNASGLRQKYRAGKHHKQVR